MQIGYAYSGTSKNGKTYISIRFDKGVLALIPILNNIRLTLWFISKENRKSEKSPSWSLELSEPWEKEEKKSEKNDEISEISDEELLF